MRAVREMAAAVSPLLATKLAAPPLAPLLIPRSRLTDGLQLGPTCPVALVVAPAGSGKSSLVRQWCQQPGSGRTAWVSLDAGDNDPVRFVRYVCAALENAGPEAAAPARLLVQSPQPPPLDDALTLLLNGLEALPAPVTLMLDDYHEIEAPAVHQLLAFVIEHLPSTLFLVLASRREPPLPLARLRASRRLIEVGAADLRFTLAEVNRLLNDGMGLRLAPAAVQQLTERTEGWIIGLQLAALSLQGHPEPEQFIDSFTGSNRFLVDYLVEEVLRRQSPAVNDFLQQTAILERFCGPLCEAVTRVPGGQAMLEQLEAAGLFLIPLDTERRWYRYHHLFAEVLRARPQPSGEQSAALHERAASWFGAEGLTGEAVEHALAGGHWDRAARLIEQCWERLFRYDEMGTVERWLRALPAVTRRRPLLALTAAVIAVRHLQVAEAETALADARREPGHESEAPRELEGKVQVLRGFIARETRAKLKARVDEAQAKLDAANERATAWLDRRHRETEAKVRALKAQAAKAHGDARARSEERAAQLHADYERRSAQLKQALALTKEALAP